MISVHVVLDKKAKIKEFLEKEIQECGREEGAERIRVLIKSDQVYSPILGESTEDNPNFIRWEESSTFNSFSYSQINQQSGFIKLQKKPPPLMLYCDNRQYAMMMLKTSSKGKLPDHPIYNHGANIDPTSCIGAEKLPDLYAALHVSSTPSHPASRPAPTSSSEHALIKSDEAPISAVEVTPDDQLPGPSNIDLMEILKSQENEASSGGGTIRHQTC